MRLYCVSEVLCAEDGQEVLLDQRFVMADGLVDAFAKTHSFVEADGDEFEWGPEEGVFESAVTGGEGHFAVFEVTEGFARLQIAELTEKLDLLKAAFPNKS